jgi:hypothetical protein
MTHHFSPHAEIEGHGTDFWTILYVLGEDRRVVPKIPLFSENNGFWGDVFSLPPTMGPTAYVR